MKRGLIPISKEYELEYRYYEKNPEYKYFNRKFEILLLEKKTLKKNYILHMDNNDMTKGNFKPRIYTASNQNKKLNLGVTTLNWNDIKSNFSDIIISEIGPSYKDRVKKALNQLYSPKI